MSSKLLTRKPVASSPSRIAAIRQLVMSDLHRVDAFPTLSETTVRAMVMVNDPNVSSAEVASMIRRDAVVAAAILRRANNWTYGGHRVINNLQQAVLRVGLQECSKILCAMGLRSMYERYPRAVQERCDMIQRHSLFVAQLASEMNRTAGFGFAGVEFTTGLLHDIGRVIMVVRSPPIDELEPTDRDGDDILTHERDTYGIDHCALGYQFATRNNLPEPLVRVILNHHRPQDEMFQTHLVALVALCNRIANHAQREHSITSYNLSTCPHFPVLARGWSGQREDAFARALTGIVLRAFKATRQMLNAFG